MEFSREIYWNVGHGAGTLLPMYLLAFAAFGVIAWGFYRRMQVYRLGKEANRRDSFWSRAGLLAEGVLTQAKIFRVPGAGTAHAVFLWSFVLLVIGTTLIFIQADFLDLLFGIKFLKGGFYKVFSFTLDIAGLLALIMMAGLLVRRFFVKPDGLETIKDDYIMHALLFAILLTGFFIEGARMAATEMKTAPEMMRFSPVGLVFAKMLAGMGEQSLLSFHKGAWWVHFFLVIGFFCSIPFTKFRHIVTTSANYFFMDRGPKGKLSTINMEDEEAESFGASKVADFTWKDIFDTDACTKCKRCQDRCPAYATDKPLSPMKLINQMNDTAFADPEANLIETVSTDVLWACTTCRACQDICPAVIEHPSKIVEMRRNLVLMEGEFPGEEVMTAMENTEVNGNPFGMAFASRGDWASDLDIAVLSKDSDVDIMYFAGCYASFDKRNITVSRNFMKLCSAAGVKAGIMGKEEKCCGEPMRKMGNEYLYQSLAAENVEMFQKYNVKHIVTACPHCFTTLGRDYADIGLEGVTVEHYTTYLERLLKEGRLDIKADRSFECTLHDSCYMGRYSDVYDAPRELISAAGGMVNEMEKSRADSFCCGAGGGRIMAEEKIGSKISVARVNMALETGSDTLVSNCPFCLTMFEDGIKMAEAEDRIKVRDISEVLASKL